MPTMVGPQVPTLQLQCCRSWVWGTSLVKQNGLYTEIKGSSIPMSCTDLGGCLHMSWATVSPPSKRDSPAVSQGGYEKQLSLSVGMQLKKSHNEINTWAGKLFNTKAYSFPSKEKFTEKGEKGELLSSCSDCGNRPSYLLLHSEPPTSPLLQEKEIIFNYSFTVD